MVSLHVTLPEDCRPKNRRSYFTWVFGKVPELVIEVVSNREGSEAEKARRYAKMGVRYYVVFDPERWLGEQVLRGYVLHGLELRGAPGPVLARGAGPGPGDLVGPLRRHGRPVAAAPTRFSCRCPPRWRRQPGLKPKRSVSGPSDSWPGCTSWASRSRGTPLPPTRACHPGLPLGPAATTATQRLLRRPDGVRPVTGRAGWA
jgi:hypothetical protein